MRVNIENLAICDDCTQAIVNDDYTGLDYHYSQEEADQKHKEIVAGMLALASFGSLCMSDEESDEFSRRPCDCCNSRLAGRRHFFHTLIEG